MHWVFGAIEELLPVIIFFVVQQQVGFQAGLIAMTITLSVLLVYARLTNQTAPRFAAVSTAAFLLFAVPSILLRDAFFFQISDTILDGAFAILLLGSWLLQVPTLKYLFESIFAITDRAWHTLSFRWGILFLVLAILNEIFRQLYNEDVWSLYKLSSTIVILLFGVYQFTLSSRERLPGKSNKLGLRTNDV